MAHDVPPARDPQTDGDRIARLLDELQGMAGPSAWQRVEELLRCMLSLQAEALDRVLGHASAAGAVEAVFAERLAADDLVSSVLLLHGLHPAPTEARVRRALEAAVRPGGAGGAELLEIGPDRVVRLRVPAAGGARLPPGAALALERAILEAAPEVTRVEIEGLAGGDPSLGGKLVRIGPPRTGAGASR
jgi:hypothetical protein